VFWSLACRNWINLDWKTPAETWHLIDPWVDSNAGREGGIPVPTSSVGTIRTMLAPLLIELAPNETRRWRGRCGKDRVLGGTGRERSRGVRGWDFALLPLVATRVVDHGRTTMRSTRKAGRDKAGGAGGGALPVHGAPLLGEEGDRGGRLQNGEGAPPGGAREEGRTVEGHPTARGEVAGPHHRGGRVPVLARAVEPGAGAECGRVSDSHGWLCIVLRRGGTAGAAGNVQGSLLAPATGYGGCRGAWCHTCAATKEAGVPGLVRCVTFHSRACCFPGVGYWHPWEAVRDPLALPTP